MTEPSSFVAMRLTGRRFEDGGMPVEALPELAAYRDLVLSVARELYLRQNRARQRVPRGFADSFELRLREINKGSAVPVLERVIGDGALLPSSTDRYFDDARDMVQNAILSVAGSGRLPESFPARTLPEFSRFGRTLKAGEFIELSSPVNPRPARYSAAVRRILIKSKRTNYIQESVLDGVISEINSGGPSFQLAMRGRPGTITCTFEPELFASVRTYLRAPDEEGVPVRVEGFVSFDPSDRPIAVPHVLGIATPDADEDDGAEAPTIDVVSTASGPITAALQRLSEIESLEAGWLDGEGDEVSAEALRFLRGLLTQMPASTVGDLRFFPTETGAIKVEWQRYSTEFSLDVNGDGTVVYDEIDLHTGSETERDLTFDDVDDIRVLVVGA
ncbi:hypothetical protein ACL02T_05375 [Pseudonocardia sp. RS010]|uniref:hypothetical protein n=1 Tax=Pseudonocardia sp. RS010 TaxID=3385979 RepID=UPI0039A07317